MKEVLTPSKDRALYIRVDDDLHRKIKSAAKKAKLSMAEYVRRAAIAKIHDQKMPKREGV